MIYKYKNELGNIKKIKSTNDIDVGDVVFVKNYGKSYTSYQKAMDFFNIPRKKLYNFWGNPYERSWLVMDIAIHACGDVVLLCLKNSNMEFLIINVEGVTKRHDSKYKSKLESKKNEFLIKIEQ